MFIFFRFGNSEAKWKFIRVPLAAEEFIYFHLLLLLRCSFSFIRCSAFFFESFQFLAKVFRYGVTMLEGDAGGQETSKSCCKQTSLLKHPLNECSSETISGPGDRGDVGHRTHHALCQFCWEPNRALLNIFFTTNCLLLLLLPLIDPAHQSFFQNILPFLGQNWRQICFVVGEQKPDFSQSCQDDRDMSQHHGQGGGEAFEWVWRWWWGW